MPVSNKRSSPRAALASAAVGSRGQQRLAAAAAQFSTQPQVPKKAPTPQHAGPSAVGDAAPLAARIELVDDNHAGQRLDNFLLFVLRGVPKALIYRIVRSGEVRVNGGRREASDRVEMGDKVRIPPIRVQAPSADTPRFAPGIDKAKLTVLFEDEVLLAVDKPAGLAVHGGSGVSFGVIEALRAARPGAHFLELVHRIDRETSGVLLIAKKRSALLALHAQLRERDDSMDKRYLALVDGAFRDAKRKVDVALFKYTNRDGERRVRVDDALGASSVTVFTRERVFGEGEVSVSLLSAQILTGRTHQIRVQLAHLGHPILGDDKYGRFELNHAVARAGLKRMFLHAQQISFNHPVSGLPTTIRADLPPELSRYLAYLAESSQRA